MDKRFFHPISRAPEPEVLGHQTRAFVGEGTPYLTVPGCKEVAAVRIGQMELPESETRKFPTDTSHENFEHVEIPLWGLHQSDDGPVLLRGIHSNDGIWQKGAQIFVTGKWEGEDGEEKEEEFDPLSAGAASTSGLEALTVAQLQELARKNDVSVDGTKKADYVAALDAAGISA